jgi:hypothetical protein
LSMYLAMIASMTCKHSLKDRWKCVEVYPTTSSRKLASAARYWVLGAVILGAA